MKVDPNLTLPRSLALAHERKALGDVLENALSRLASSRYDIRAALRMVIDDDSVLNPDGSRRPLCTETVEKVQQTLTALDEMDLGGR